MAKVNTRRGRCETRAPSYYERTWKFGFPALTESESERNVDEDLSPVMRLVVTPVATAIRQMMAVPILAFAVNVPAWRRSVVTRRRSAVMPVRTAVIAIIRVLSEGRNRHREERERR
jgi:hypothetical protein